MIIGRRGPLQTAFTTLELRELADLEGVDVIVDPAELEGITDEDAAAVGKVCKQNIKVLRDYAGREPRPGHRRMVFRFLTSPIEIKGDGKVEQIVLGRNELVTDDSGWVSAKDTGEREELPVQLVVRSVGYRGVPTPGLPFDDKSGTIPNTDGRVEGSRNEYVVGWIKRGPTGVIGTNKKDSQDTVDTVLADSGRRRAMAGFPATTTPTSWPTGWPRASPSWSPPRTGRPSTASNARPVSRTGVPASSCRAWPSYCASATADHGSSSTPGLRMPGRVERGLGRAQGRRERVRALPVVPGAVVATDRVVVGDGAAGGADRLGHGGFDVVPLRVE